MKLLRLMLMLLTLLPLSACALSGGPIVGQVMEEGTHKPVPGAVVVANWVGSVPAFVESQLVCVHVESTVTDREGKYKLPRWSKPSTVGPVVMNLEPVVAAYKAGYEWSEKPSQKIEIEYLVPFKGGKKERFDYLSRVISGTTCVSAGESYKNLYRVTHAVYEEAREIAQTADEKRRAERFREFAEDTLVDRSKPTKYDNRGRLINVNPEDSFRREDLK
jgi:hypothetical protein